jgi:hypothetical protein
VLPAQADLQLLDISCCYLVEPTLSWIPVLEYRLVLSAQANLVLEPIFGYQLVLSAQVHPQLAPKPIIYF